VSLFDLLGLSRSAATPPTTTTTMMGWCTCCARLEGDYTEKPVAYCSLCDAWLCERCRGDWLRRARAALRG
jgi:hypothetical protein